MVIPFVKLPSTVMPSFIVTSFISSPLTSTNSFIYAQISCPVNFALTPDIFIEYPILIFICAAINITTTRLKYTIIIVILTTL